MWTATIEASQYKMVLLFEHLVSSRINLYMVYFTKTAVYGYDFTGRKKYLIQENDYDLYSEFISNVGWGEEVHNGIPDTDPRVKKILENTEIKKILDEYVNEHMREIIPDVLEHIRRD